MWVSGIRVWSQLKKIRLWVKTRSLYLQIDPYNGKKLVEQNTHKPEGGPLDAKIFFSKKFSDFDHSRLIFSDFPHWFQKHIYHWILNQARPFLPLCTVHVACTEWKWGVHDAKNTDIYVLLFFKYLRIYTKKSGGWGSRYILMTIQESRATFIFLKLMIIYIHTALFIYLTHANWVTPVKL